MYLTIHILFISVSFAVFSYANVTTTPNVDQRILLNGNHEMETVVPMEIAAIGRVADLGELYDFRTDKFLHISLFTSRLDNKLIVSTENKETKLLYTFLNTYEEKFSSLDISAEFKVSILSGLIELEGSGRFFKDTKKSKRSAKASLINSFLTVYETISITGTNIEKKYVDFDILEKIDATHVVVGIQWGGRIFVSVEDANLKNSDQQVVEGSMHLQMKKLAGLFDVSGNASVNISDSDKQEFQKFNFEVYGDIVPVDVPQSLIQAVKFMKTAPKLLQEGNGGKGKALKYVLIPVKLLRSLWSVSTAINSIVKRIGDETVKKCVTFFDNMNAVEQKVNDIHSDITKMDPYIETDAVERISELRHNYDYHQARVRKNLSETFILVRAGNKSVEQLEEVLIHALEDPYSWQGTELKLKQFGKIIQEMEFIKLISSKALNVTVLSKYSILQLFLWENYNKDIFILFYNYDKVEENNFHAINMFIKIVENKYYTTALFAAVNNEVLYGEKNYQFQKLRGNKPKISYFRNGELLVDNFDFILNDTDNNCTSEEIWPLSYMQLQILDLMKNQGYLMKNQVPVGFIYVQLPNQPEPRNLWPNLRWLHISSNYSGHFFRVEGGNAAPFGQSQSDAFQGHGHMLYFQDLRVYYNSGNHKRSTFDWNSNTRSDRIREPVSDGVNGSPRIAIETRPINYAIRVWKRIA